MNAPPHWKMAVLTWVGVNPAIILFSGLISPILHSWPGTAVLLVVNLFVVAALEWLIMPALKIVFARWLVRSPTYRRPPA